MRKEDIRGIYDGSIFYKKADDYRLKQMRVHQQSRTSSSLVTKAAAVLGVSAVSTYSRSWL